MDPLRIYDYLTLSRKKVLDAARDLTDAQWRQEFDIGLGSVGRTLTHLMICEWFYIERLEGRTVPPYEEWPIQDEKPPDFDVIEMTWAAQAVETRAAMERVRDWSKRIEFASVSHPDEPDRQDFIITATAGDLVTQLFLHEMYHRAQVANMLRRLGAPIDGDIDYSTLMYDKRESGG